VRVGFMSDIDWRCEYSQTEIEVYRDGRFIGSYELLPVNSCEICASPTNTILDFSPTQLCTSHQDLYGFNRIYAVGKYIASPPWDHLLSSHIRRLKNNIDFAEPLCESLSLVIKNRYPELCDIDIVVPVPMFESKFEDRGFNQAEILGRKLSRIIDRPMLECLNQVKNIELRGLTREERKIIVRDAYEFIIEYGGRIDGKHILLIDDVVTTGFTASQCSQILINNGACQVDVIVLGRTSDR